MVVVGFDGALVEHFDTTLVASRLPAETFHIGSILRHTQPHDANSRDIAETFQIKRAWHCHRLSLPQPLQGTQEGADGEATPDPVNPLFAALAPPLGFLAALARRATRDQVQPQAERAGRQAEVAQALAPSKACAICCCFSLVTKRPQGKHHRPCP